jgi:hypothetical protein
MQAKCLLLSYEISLKRNKADQALPLLEKAKEIQLKSIKRAQVDNPDLLEEYKVNLSM